MRKYILQRLLWLIPVLFLISLISYFLMYLSPGDPATILLSQNGEALDAQQVEAMREELSLDDPAWKQYLNWIGGILLHGDFGTSIFTKQPVLTEIQTYFPFTVKLSVISMLLVLLISIPVGILAAVKENKAVDYVIRFLSFVANSLPGFFLALLLILLFGVKLQWLPVVSSNSSEGMVIPALTLAICMSGSYIRQVRTAVVQELGEPYIAMARARGIKEHFILYKGALKSALPALLTIAGMNFGHLLGGTAIIEMVCTFPGLGKLAVNSITNRDYPLMQAYVLLMAVIYVVVNLVVDILHAYSDLRVKNRIIEEGKNKQHDKTTSAEQRGSA